MNPQLSDFILRYTLGLIIVGIIGLQTHAPFRDRSARFALPMIAMVCAMLLIHLPRLPSVVTWVRSTAAPIVVLSPQDHYAIKGMHYDR